MYRRSILFALLGLLSMSLPVQAAGPATAIWGVFRCAADDASSCEHLTEVEHALEKRLQFLVIRPAALTSGGTAALAAVTPAQSAQQLKQSCPSGSGRVLGAIVQQQQNLTQVRSWLYDIESQQLAVRDDYCQSCVLTNAVLDQANALLEHPNFGTPPAGAVPAYCQDVGAPRRAPPTRTGGRVALLVFGEGRGRNVVRDGVIDHLRMLGRQATPAQVERKQLGIAELRKLLDGDKRSQVLVVELTPQGAELSLFDGTTELTEAQHLACETCEQRQLLDKVNSGAGALLDHCFGDGCAEAGGQAAPPPEACRPFPEPPAPSVAAGTAAQTVYRADPKFAKLTKGALWGLFTAGAATTVGLAIANKYVVDHAEIVGQASTGMTVTIPDAPLGNVLNRAAWTAGVFSAAILGISIPITISLSRSLTTQQRSLPNIAPPFQCNL